MYRLRKQNATATCCGLGKVEWPICIGDLPRRFGTAISSPLHQPQPVKLFCKGLSAVMCVYDAVLRKSRVLSVLTFRSISMDNVSFRIEDVAVAKDALFTALKNRVVNVSLKDIPKAADQQITFSLPVGPHQARWMFRLNRRTKSILCTGGVTTTFFGHNVWVFGNEAVQLRAITKIVCDELRSIDGLTLKPAGTISLHVERVERTRHFVMPPGVALDHAVKRLDLLFMTLFSKRRFRNGEKHDDPGTTGVGQNKSSRICRVYDPASKFLSRPDHIPAESWERLRAACAHHLRVETITGKRELAALGLNRIEGWEDLEELAALDEKQYQHLGLSVAYMDTNKHFKKEDVRAKHPTFVDFATHFFHDGAKGSLPNPRSGAANRFRQYMQAHGFRIDVPYSQHTFLVHGLHEVLVPSRSAELLPEVRRDPHLFGQWWNQATRNDAQSN